MAIGIKSPPMLYVNFDEAEEPMLTSWEVSTNIVKSMQSLLTNENRAFEVYVNIANSPTAGGATYMITETKINCCCGVYVPSSINLIAREMDAIKNKFTEGVHMRIYSYHHHFPKLIPKFKGMLNRPFVPRYPNPNYHIHFIHHPQYDEAY